MGSTLSAPFWSLCQKLSLSLLYFNKILLHKSSEWSSLVIGPGFNSFPPEAKNPSIFHGSATTFQQYFLKLIKFVRGIFSLQKKWAEITDSSCILNLLPAPGFLLFSFIYYYPALVCYTCYNRWTNDTLLLTKTQNVY